MKNQIYLFSFLKYVKPIWYFNLKADTKIPYWVDYNKLSEEEKALIDFDSAYSSDYASLCDGAYQAWQKGIIQFNENQALDVSSESSKKIRVKDQYRFIKKYFNSRWSLIVLFMRLIAFNNPFKEISGFWASRKINKIDIYQHIQDWSELETKKSELISSNPLVSVIIPTLNRYKYLDDVIKDLEKQDYKNIEVIVCDQSDDLDEEFYKNRNLKLKLIKQEEKALWLARNRCVKESSGEYLLFFDDDSRVDPDWVSNHLKCIDYFNVKISSGVSLSVVGARVPKNYAFFRWSDQIDTGNVMLHRSVFEITGLFDRQFEKMRMGDGEFGLRCYLKGLANISNPLSKRVHLKVGTGGLRHMGNWDAFRGKNFFSSKPIPSVLYLIRKYYGNKVARFYLTTNLPFSMMPYKLKNNQYLAILGLFLFVLLLPKLFIQVTRSWLKSSKMLKSGSKIEEFK